MNLFLNETQLKVVGLKKQPSPEGFDNVLDLRTQSLAYNQLKNNVLLMYPSPDMLKELVRDIIHHKLEADTIVAVVTQPKEAKKAIKSNFKIINAGGGVVCKQDRYLMMYRMKHWDLPKGKMDEGESFKQTAKREVEEECNIKVRPEKRIATTWHHYQQKDLSILKRTRWYAMQCLEDKRMKPQYEEDIEQLAWLTKAEVEEKLKQSYRSISFVMERFFEQLNRAL